MLMIKSHVLKAPAFSPTGALIICKRIVRRILHRPENADQHNASTRGNDVELKSVCTVHTVYHDEGNGSLVSDDSGDDNALRGAVTSQ